MQTGRKFPTTYLLMNRRQLILTLVAGATLSLHAQHYVNPNEASLYKEEAARLTEEEFYYGSQNLKATKDEALTLINAYYLNTPGTRLRIGEWLDAHAVHPERSRLQMMEANLLVKEEKYERAFDIYNNIGWDAFDNLPQKEQTEANLYGAIAYINTGDLDKAESMLNSVKDSPFHQADIYYYLGYIRYAKADYSEAVNYFTAVEESEEYRNLAPVYLADSYLNLGRNDLAYSKIKNWRQTHGGASVMADEARRIEGEALYGLGNYQQAVEPLRGYVAAVADPKRSAMYKLGMSELQTRNYAEAAKMLSRSAGMATDAMAQSAWLNAGKAYVANESKRQAGMAFQQAAGMDADKGVQEEAFYNYALTLHDGATLGFGESVSAFEQFLNKYPRSQYATSVSQHLTEVYFTTKNYKAALNSINKIKNPSADIISAKQKVLYNLGTQSFAAGDYKAAKAYMTQSNATLRNPEAVFWKGEAEYRLGDLNSAATDYASYIKNGANADNKALAHYGNGYVSFKNHKYANALNSFRNYLNACKNQQNSGKAELQADAWNRIGDCLYTQRKFDQANDAYRNSMTTHKAYGDYALLQMAMISGLKGNYQEKVALLDQLSNSYDRSDYADNALFEQGRAYVLSGNSDAAMNTFTLLTRKYPGSTNARRALNEIGMIYQESGNTEEAIRQYTSVVEQYHNTEEASAALESLKQIYTAQGRVNEYATIAAKAGKPLSPDELDELTENAAVMATANEEYAKATAYYRQLASQTLSEDTRSRAMENGLECAAKAGDNQEYMAFASMILDGNTKISPDKMAQARLLRAQHNMKEGLTDQALADYRILALDNMTVYGAQGLVEMAQYYYDIEQYGVAEQMLDRFIDSGTSHSYWLARAFILLADVYLKTDRAIEAQEYLLSLKTNYTESAEINQMIDERLKKIQ